MIKVGIIGATGFAGAELLGLLLSHGESEVIALTDINYIGTAACEVFPQLRGYALQLKHLRIEGTDIGLLSAKCDVVFMAMPHGQAAPLAAKLVAAGVKVIDIGSDFRFTDVAVYKEWYKMEHAAQELLPQAVYGLPELFRDEIGGAAVVGNPGCYPTASLLALYPLLKAGIIALDSVIIDAKSGTSGAGRTPSAGNIYCEVNESLKAYNIAAHRHTPEIEMGMTKVTGSVNAVSFTPHLVPMNRGILATVYANVTTQTDAAMLHELYIQTYKDERFVVVHERNIYPQTKWACGTNECHIGLTYDSRTGRAVIVSAIDNLIKGAAGQAVQNMNILFGLPEVTGLELRPLVP